MLEIIIPVRNPTEVLEKTIGSLVAQTDRGFSVLLSDNHSTKGLELLEAAVRALEEAGVPTCVVRPPEELGRVEHWNWAHLQGKADWLKPLFAGDWLEPGYVSAVQEVIRSGTKAEIINCSMASHLADGRIVPTILSGGWQSPEAVLDKAFRFGNTYGGPVNICFRRLAFETSGGFPCALPISADFFLILMLALRKGIWSIAPSLVNFNYHPNRFSTNFPWARINGPREYRIILGAATSYAALHSIPYRSVWKFRLHLKIMKNEMITNLRKLFGR